MENNENQVNYENQVKNEEKVKPPKTDLQKAKKKLWLMSGAWFGGSILLFIISGLLGEAGVFTICLGLIFLLFLPLMFIVLKLQIHRVHCKFCGTKYDYAKDVRWVCESEETKSGKSGNDLTKTVKASVSFNCTCHKCKQTKDFRKKFTTAEWNSSRGWKYYNLESECKKYFTVK